jgi:diadenosine tetraphosphate (Ap4A) HIT family hydrolase
MQTSTCNLCTITDSIIARGDLWTMALNRNQKLLGRCYFALNRHTLDFTTLTDDETLALQDWFQRAKAALDILFSPDHYNYVALMNVEPHVHAHIIPRYKGMRQFEEHTFIDSNFGGNFDFATEFFMTDEEFDRLTARIASVLPPEGARS